MAETVLQQLDEEEGYIRTPYSYYKRHKRRSLIMLLSTVFSLSDAENARCNMSFSQFEKKLNLSHGSVARGIKMLKESGEIEQDKSFRFRSSYSDAKRTTESGFVKIEFYLYNTKFDIRGESEARNLTKSEIDVLCLIKTHCTNEKGEGCFVGSVRGIAGTLNLSPRIVQKALKTLLHAGLIYRSKEGLGVNGHKRSVYTVNEKLLRRKEKNYKKVTAPKDSSRRTRSEEEKNEEYRIERERYYEELRKRAQSRAAFFTEQLNQDDTYKELTIKWNGFSSKIGRAMAYNLPELDELQKEQLDIGVQLAQRMTQLHIRKSDLIPRYQCKKCSDSGYLPDGKPCNCYPERGRKK